MSVTDDDWEQMVQTMVLADLEFYTWNWLRLLCEADDRLLAEMENVRYVKGRVEFLRNRLTTLLEESTLEA